MNISNQREICPASVDDTELIADILGDAFLQDLIICHAAGGQGFAKELFRTQFQAVYAPFNNSFLLRNEQGQAMGCTLWSKPGQAIPKIFSWAAVRISWTIINNTGFGSLKRFIDLAELLEQYHPSEPHFYLHALGVKGRFQRQGVGSRLLNHGLAMADQAQMPTYLENSNEANLSLYQKYGFEVIEKADTPNGGPPIWFMYRSPTKLDI